MQDSGGRPLLDHGGIWVVELEKFRSQEVRSETDRWLRFFRDGERLDDGHLPDWMMTSEMRQAMSTIREFSERDSAYHAYQARLDFLRQQGAIEEEFESLREEALNAQREAKQEREANLRLMQAAKQEREEKLRLMQEREEMLRLMQEKQTEMEKLQALLAEQQKGGATSDG
jgi:hypothetical protein